MTIINRFRAELIVDDGAKIIVHSPHFARSTTVGAPAATGRTPGEPPCVTISRIVAGSRSARFRARELPDDFLIDNLRHVPMTGEWAAGNINIFNI
ncbi:TPA: hypothetical protein SAY52_006807 [Burkholderia cenocepacia]|uniref:hypothetical protein n=1 Tax=unclassified Burkholderia TaxID=2613784 RepID=UPI00158E9A62|nr:MULTISPECIES: hypothetical protein [unclassified Burkholderia]HEF5875153.1 hypothetical protein [Burkholderia cenocepacia]HEF5876077.1 hypothetical protein [Burkholderia cenocepacia]